MLLSGDKNKNIMSKFPKKNRQAQMSGSAVIGLLIVIILVVISINIAVDLINATSELQSNEQTLVYNTAPSAQSFQLTPIGQEVVTSTVTINISGTLNNVSTDGILFLTNATNQSVLAVYNFQPTGFSTGLTTTVVAFVPVFLALIALFAAAAFVAFKP